VGFLVGLQLAFRTISHGCTRPTSTSCSPAILIKLRYLRSNQATGDCIAAVATAMGPDIDREVGNPTGDGIHTKWLLAPVDGVTWAAVSSLNGGEISYAEYHLTMDGR
jgi:hypothetical protein